MDPEVLRMIRDATEFYHEHLAAKGDATLPYDVYDVWLLSHESAVELERFQRKARER